MSTDVETTVRVLLAAAGLSPSEDEVASLVKAYVEHKASIEILHAVPGTRYESPALIFNPTPVFADWSEP